MKKVSSFTCWTDYPFIELGDVEFKKAPIRQVTVVAYDGNKIATVVPFAMSQHLHVKAGYLYSKRGRCGQVKTVNRRKLERMTRHGD